jgi:hypothetical protein
MTALTDPEWLAHRYDPEHDAVHFVRAPRAVRRSTPFLLDEYLRPDAPLVETRREAMAARSRAPVHFVFHSAFCCSTLMAAALDIPGLATSFKEPVALNDIVGMMHRGAERRRVVEALDGVLHLLTPFAGERATVIKPSNVVNGLASAMLGLRPEARAILMYAPLRIFLASIARKGMDGRLWVRDLVAKQMLEGFGQLGFEPRDHLLHTDLQAAAVGWLAQHQLFGALAARWPERVRTLDSEALIAAPEAHLRAAAALIGLDLGDQAIEAIVGDVFSRNAKDGAAFSAGRRAAEARDGSARHADEIDKVTVWAEAVAAAAGVSLRLPLPLV